MTDAYKSSYDDFWKQYSEGNSTVLDLIQQQIKSVTIGTRQIANGAITADQLANGSIHEAHFSDLSVSNAAIQNLAVTTAKIEDLSVTNLKIADLAVTEAKIDDLAVTTLKVADAAITEAKIGNAQISTAKIKNLAVTTALIADAAITTTQIADQSVTDSKVVSLTADKLTAGTIDASVIDVKNLVADNIVTGTITVASANLFSNTDYHDLAGLRATAGLSVSLGSNLGPDGRPYLYASQTGTTELFMYLDRVPLQGGKKVTITFWYYNDSTTVNGGDFYLLCSDTLDGSYANRLDTSYNAQTGNYHVGTFDKSGSWVKVQQTFTLDASMKSGFIRLDHNGSSTAGTTSAIRFTPIMVQYGDLATEWQPSTNELLIDKGITNIQLGDSAVDNRVITANTITGDRLVVDAITAREIASKTITANEIAANTITAASGIIANAAITTAMIADASITNAKIDMIYTSKLYVGDFTNYCTNPQFQDGTNTDWSSNSAVVDTSTLADAANAPAKYANHQTARDCLNGQYFPVSEGDQFYVEAWVLSANAAGAYDFGIGLQMQKDDGTYTWPRAFTVPSTQTTWVKVSGTITVPAGFTRAQVWAQDSVNGTTDPDGFYYTKVVVRRVNEGVLIQDGAITANKLSVNSLSAITANLGTINAGTLNAVTLNGADGTFSGSISTADLLLKASNFDTIGSTKLSFASGFMASGGSTYTYDGTLYLSMFQHTLTIDVSEDPSQPAWASEASLQVNIPMYVHSIYSNNGTISLNNDTNVTGVMTASNGYKKLGSNAGYYWTGTVPYNGTVTVTHNLGYIPMVTLYGSLGNVNPVLGNVTNTTFQIYNYNTGSNPWSGTVYCW